MKRRIAYLILITVFASLHGMAQTVVVTDDNGVTTGDASSVLDVKSTSKGFLAPRMTEAQRIAISSPATGLLVYQTNNTAGYYYYDGSNWVVIAKGAGWTPSGNNIYYNTGKVGIGNTSPGEALDVTGNINFSGALMPGNDAGTATHLLTSAGAGAAPTWANPATYFESYAWKLDGNNVASLKKIGTTSNYDLPFITNNTEKMRLTSGGYLGIGVDSPAAPIHVGRTSPTSGITPIALFEETRDAGLSNSVVMMLGNKSISSNATKFLIGSTSSSKRWIMGTDKDGNNSQNFYLWDDNSVLARLYIDGSNGYTGLGTAAPQSLLHVYSHLPPMFDVPAALFEGESDGGTVSISLRNNSGARTKTAFIFGGSSSSYQWSIGNDVQGNNEHNFYIYDEGSFNTRFFIDASGNVGIGNIVPTELLDVSGNVKFSGAIMPANDAGTSGYVLTSAGAGNAPTWTDPATYLSGGWALDGNTVSSAKKLGTLSYHDLPIITNNVEKMRILADGKIGIGTATPTQILDVAGNIRFSGALMPNNLAGSTGTFLMSNGSNTSPTWGVGWKGGGNDLNSPGEQDLGTTTYHDLPIITNDLERMRVKADGKVGIGTTTPAQVLDVTGNIGFSGALMPNNNAGTSGYFLTSGGANVAPTWTNPTTLAWKPDGNDMNSVGIKSLGTTSYHDLPFITNNTEKMRILADGKVGVGTNTPAQLLDVAGNVKLTGALMPNNDAGTSGYFLTSGGANTAPTWTNPTTLAWKPGGNDMNSVGVQNLGTTSYHDLPFVTNNSEKLRIKADGKIGVGTNAPSEILEVVGNIKFSGALMPNNAAGSSGSFLMSAGAGASPTWGTAWKPGGNDLNALGMQNFGPTSYHDLPFITAGTEKMRIKADGKVGIANTNPAEALDVTGNIKLSGNITGGSWGGSIIGPTYGGTGVNNGTKTITLGGNLTTSGANNLTLTTTALTNVTLPTSGTLVSDATTSLPNLTSAASLATVGTITSGTWSGNTIAVNKGGTNITSYASGSILYASGATTISQVTPNGTAIQKFLSQTSAGTPTWDTLTATDVPGALINVRVLTTGTSYTPTAGTTKIQLFLLGGGGGGGGAQGNANQVGAAGGGGSGSTFLGLINGVSSSSSYTYSIGTGGSAGANTSGNGGTGGTTSITIASTTYSAPGGSGGIGMAPATAVSIVAGGAGGVVATGGTGHMYGTGTPGNRGIRMSGTVGGSGEGAGSIYGGGGTGLTVGNAGNNATGYGAGGGGALSTNATDRAGGTGSPGLIIIHEYR